MAWPGFDETDGEMNEAHRMGSVAGSSDFQELSQEKTVNTKSHEPVRIDEGVIGVE
eukprot:CAMPEP_0206319718 /NCGR_PEP_ID=MMETSP0106_2-20121207/17918_1 /ASSEMBLY_ACC=CAM_ASM_000206 /TAXON_ID=81532 /ORGANISM="Acanthoeca-like sp., Strain 10tr" /LENGTH=55 /DNA_ID=CAMNT_0053751595 /DNA_START=46 /DNA_END=210 /DNA_ORIENTATION=-